MEQQQGAEAAWPLEWVWVSGYSSLATLVIVTNLVLIAAIGKNKYLHFSFHYAVIALALRNILRVLHSCWIVALAKLVQTPALFRLLYQLDPAAQLPPDPSSAAALPVTCQLLCTADTFLMSVTMFYIATLAIYVFCRPAQPDFPAHYNKPVSEQCWVGSLVVLVPPLLSCLLCLPGPLLQIYHELTALPQSSVCGGPYSDTATTFNTATAILGFLLPLVTVITLTLALMVRRCLACGRRRCSACCSSHCKEELVVVLASCLYTATHTAIYLPTLDIYLQRYDLPTTGAEIGSVLTPEVSRLAETVAGLLLPLLLLAALPTYRAFASAPDEDDLNLDTEAEEEAGQQGRLARLSQESFDLQLVTRNGHLAIDEEDRIY